jgi:hypothetical protein
MSSSEALIIMVPLHRRDDIVDALMGCEALGGFTLSRAGGFSREHVQLDLRERVQGYRDVGRFEVLCTPDVRADLLVQLAAVAGNDHFRYWVLPLLEEGSLGRR